MAKKETVEFKIHMERTTWYDGRVDENLSATRFKSGGRTIYTGKIGQLDELKTRIRADYPTATFYF